MAVSRTAVSRTAVSRRRVAGALVAIAASGLFKSSAAAGRFKLFDALLHRGKPNLQRLGLEPLPMVWNFWSAGVPHDQVDEAAIARAIRDVPHGTEAFHLDIEDWPVLNVSPATRQQSIRKLTQVAQSVRRLSPRSQFGFYGLAPAITYWPLVDNRPAEYADWQESNRLLEPLAALTDFVLPSLYTFYTDRRGWLAYAEATIRESRRYGKPVYPFLWYSYHDSNPLLRGHDIDVDAWREELQFCRSKADGIVLWGGYQEGWSESAAWWQAIRSEFKLSG
jgi:hypothetical protein